MSGAWFTQAADAISAIPLGDAPGDVAILPLLHASRVIGEGFGILYGDGSIVCKILRDDLMNHIRGLEAAVARMETKVSSATPPDSSSAAAPTSDTPPPLTLGAVLAHELALAGGAAVARTRNTGVTSGLWLKRVLCFVRSLLTRLAADPGLSIARAGGDTYAEVLKPFHAPVMSFIVRFVLMWAPSRATAVASLGPGFDNAAACEGCTRVAKALEPVTVALVAHYEANGIDWPDKTSAVPGGW